MKKLSEAMRKALTDWHNSPDHTRSAYPGHSMLTVYSLQSRGLLRPVSGPGAMFAAANHDYRLTAAGVRCVAALTAQS